MILNEGRVSNTMSFMTHVSGYSRVQVKRLARAWLEHGKVSTIGERRKPQPKGKQVKTYPLQSHDDTF